MLSGHVGFAVTDSSLWMAHLRMRAFFMTVAGTAIFGIHCVPVEPIGTPFAVGAGRVPETLQALPSDRVTVSRLRGVHVAIALTRDTGFPRHSRVSIVTICTSFAPVSRVARCTLVTDHVLVHKVAGGAEVVGCRGKGTGARLAVPRSPSGRRPIEARLALLAVVSGGVVCTGRANTMDVTLHCMAVALAGLTNASEEDSIHTIIARQAGLTGGPCVALGTFTVLHICRYGQIDGIWARCVQRDRIQPVKSHLCRIIVGSDQEMCHIGKDGHELVTIDLPFAAEIPEVLRDQSNHIQVFFVGL